MTEVVAERPQQQTPLRLDGGSLFAPYSKEKLPLTQYAELVGLYNLAFALFLVISKNSGRRIPERLSLGDIVLLGLATFKLSRIISKDKVTSFMRAPFTTFVESCGEGEVNEKARGEGMQRVVGELLTCPFCLSTWIAAFLAYGLVLSPPITRLIAGVMAMRVISDFLHLGYASASEGFQQLKED